MNFFIRKNELNTIENMKIYTQNKALKIFLSKNQDIKTHIKAM